MAVVVTETRTSRRVLARLAAFGRVWKSARTRRSLRVACGFLLALAVIFAVGEVYLRVAPPGDIAQYMPESERTGPYRGDKRYGVQYRSLDALAADNPGRFEPYRALLADPNSPRTWAYFGSSFAQAPGMLADTTREFVPQRHTFNLGKNEPFPVRLAQAEFLLDNGLKPDRIFIVVIPFDVHYFATHALDQYRVTDGGAIAYEPRLPPIGGGLVRNSRLALKGWTRTNLHLNRPFYPSSALTDRVDSTMRADVRTVFGHFATATARHRVPVTVVLLPNYEQITKGARFAIQDALAEDARAVGFDVCDVRAPFLAWPNKPALFIPDKHFSVTGNRLLLAALVEHMKATDPRSADLPDPTAVRP